MRVKLTYFILFISLIFTNAVIAADYPTIKGELTLVRTTSEKWQATWCFEKEVNRLVFGPPVGNYRSTSWKFEDDNLQLVDHGGEDAIERSDAVPFKCASAFITPFETVIETEYVSFSRFSNGGMSVFSGHLQPWALINDEPNFIDLTEKFVALSGEVTIAPNEGVDKRRYIYFGPAPLNTSVQPVQIIDSELPIWLKELIGKTISTSQSVFNHLLEDNKPDPSQIFVAAARINEFEGFNIKGGAINNQIQFTLSGRDIIQAKDWVSKDFPRLITHEMAHIYQGAAFDMNGGYLPWLTEGGADALAFDILLQTGQWDKDFYDLYRATIFKRCEQSGSGIAIAKTHDMGRYDLAYSCGAVVNWLAADLAAKYTQNASSITIWSAMEKTPPQSTQGLEQKYRNALQSAGLNHSDIESLFDFINIEHQDMSQAINEFKANNAI